MSDPRILFEGHAPTPFTAEEIRDNCPLGRTVTTRTESPDQSPAVSVSRFLEGDEQEVTFESGGQRMRLAWTDLQAHASFPESQTTVAEETVVLPVGTSTCLRYTVIDGDETRRFWFALDRPGMPMLYTTERDGIEVERSTVVSDEIVPPSEAIGGQRA